MADLIIRTHGLTKYYGRQRGIDDLDLEIGKGDIFGYLGPNGAGKTTTIRLLLDLIRPTRGRAEVFNLDTRIHSRTIRDLVGFLPGELSLYDNLTGRELLTYLSHLRGGVDWSFVDELAERLDCNLGLRIRTLSHGNKQKVGLIQAFMHRPEMVILDEPTTGLDPIMQQEFYRLVDNARDAGATVFLSSHVLPEVERICDRVGIIREGKLIAVENVAGLKQHALRRLEIHFAASVPAEAFAGLAGVRDVKVLDGILSCTVMGTVDAVIKAASRYEVTNVISAEPNLEEIFLAYYGEQEFVDEERSNSEANKGEATGGAQKGGDTGAA